MSKGQFIGGSWVSGNADAFSSVNPSDESIVWQGSAADQEQVNNAVRVAAEALPAWSGMSFEQRLTHIDAFIALLEKNRDVFAQLISRETGKVKWDAVGEVSAMIGKKAISEKAYHERTGFDEKDTGEWKQVLRHRPHGVLAVYGPYNFPGHLPNGHIIPALMAGNTIVFKPSEQTPAVGEYMVELWHQAGLPAGVINLVQGAAEVGKALAASPVNGILFTGSAAVGALLHKQLGGQPEKMLALEMGGNNPLIVWDAGDIKAAALLAVQSAFLSSGQRCTCARRLIVEQGASGDAFLKELVKAAQGITVGPWDAEPAPFMGPVISSREADNLLASQAALLASGGSALLAMERLGDKGAFVSPGIIDVTSVANREDKEYFGPLLQVVRVSDFAAALEEANNTAYGLSAGLISDDAGLYSSFRNTIHAGIVNWNRPTCGASGALPFGGVGISGNHRPAAYYAADYCAYPVSSLETSELRFPDKLPAGIRYE